MRAHVREGSTQTQWDPSEKPTSHPTCCLNPPKAAPSKAWPCGALKQGEAAASPAERSK